MCAYSENIGLEPDEEVGAVKVKDLKEGLLSQIVNWLNEVFMMDELNDRDTGDFSHAVVDKIQENERAMMQLQSNTREQGISPKL